MRRTVVLVGKGDLAIRIASWFHADPDHDLVAIVPVIPEPDWTGSLADWARRNDVPIVESGHHRDLDLSPREGADLVFSCFYERILPAPFLARFGRALNLHNGPLPRYRGVAPINWALKNGERRHGVTIHEMTPGIDDGPIVGQASYSIYPEFDEVVTVYRRALAYGWTLFEQTMPIVDSIEPRPQDHALATYYTAADRASLGDRRDFTIARSTGGAGSGR